MSDAGPDTTNARAAVDVVTCGEAMLALLSPPAVPLEQSHQLTVTVAGAELNVAIGLARLGHRTRWISRVGADAAGGIIRATVQAEGIDTAGLVVDETAPTGILIRDMHVTRPTTVQYFRHGSAASRIGPADVELELLDGVKLLYLSGITPMLSASARSATEKLFDLAHERGVMLCLDPNIRSKLGTVEAWQAVVGPLLRRAGIVIAGSGELELLCRRESSSAARELRENGVSVVVTKNSDKSATAYTDEEPITQRPFPVQAVDVVGAGDGFTAGFLSAWLRQLDTSAALAEAAAVAGLVVAAPSDIAGLPSAQLRDQALKMFTSTTESVLR